MASQLVKSFLRRARHNARAGTPAYALVHDTKRQFASKQVDTFKREVKRRQRDVAASSPHADDYDYMRDEIAYRLVDKLRDISRTFPRVLDLQCGGGHFAKALAAHAKEGGNWSPGITQLVVADSSPAALRRGMEITKGLTSGTRSAPTLASSQYTDADAVDMDSLDFDDELGNKAPAEQHAASRQAPAHPLQDTALVPVVCSEEYLPFPPESFDLIVANLNLQWTNDLPGTLRQLRSALRPDGLLLAAMVGGDTLHELQVSSAMADFDRRGGPLPHVSPMTRMSDVGGLLQGAGFALPTVDTEEVQVGYGTAAVLMEHLQGSGDGAAGSKSRVTPRIDTMLATTAAYHVMHSEEPWAKVQAQLEGAASADEAAEVDTSVVASLHVIYASGWAPHESQQQPKARGTAKKRFDEFAEAPTPGAKQDSSK